MNLSLASKVTTLVVMTAVWVGFVQPVGAKQLVPFHQNMNQAYKEWKCKEPRSQLVYLEDEEFEGKNPSALYLPHAAVVKRCGSSVGCCKPTHVCVSAQEEDVAYIFEEILDGRKTKKEIVLTNHISCECQSRGRDPPR